METSSWKRNVHSGYADERKQSRQPVVHRSVTMSSTAPNFVAWLNRRAAIPSNASSRHDTQYVTVHTLGCHGM